MSHDLFRCVSLNMCLQSGLGSHCRRALAPAPAPELSSTHSLAPAPAPELSSTYPLALAPAVQLFKSFLR